MGTFFCHNWNRGDEQMKKNQGFLLKYEWLSLMEKLTDEDFKRMLLAMLRFRRDEAEVPVFEGEAKAVSDIIFPKLALAKRNEINGKNGGNPRLKKKITITQQTIPPHLFEEFWTAYPKKVGRAYAEKCFNKQKPCAELLKKMIEAINVQSKSEQWKREGGRFIPHPSTWLNQQRWLDCVTVKAPKKNMKIGVCL